MRPASAIRAAGLHRLTFQSMLLYLLLALGLPCATAAVPAAGTPAAPVTTTAESRPATDADVDVDVRRRFDAVYDEVHGRTVRLIAHLPLLLAAIVIVLLAARLGRLVSQRLHWLRLRTRNPYLDGLMRRIVHGVILIAGVLIALDLLNATALVGALLGSAIDPQVWGLDAAFPAGFVAMVAPHLRARRGLLAGITGAAVCLALIPFAPIGVPILVASVGILFGLPSPTRFGEPNEAAVQLPAGEAAP